MQYDLLQVTTLETRTWYVSLIVSTNTYMFRCLNASSSGSYSVTPKLHVSQNAAHQHITLNALSEYRYPVINIQSMLHVLLL